VETWEGKTMTETEPVESQSSDDVLIERIQAGDQAAFNLLYERYFGRVFGYVARRINNRADAEEAVQEVFLAVFSSLHSYRHEAPFAAWTLGIARRTVANRFRKKNHPTVPLEGTEEPHGIRAIPMVHREATPLENLECSERAKDLSTVAHIELTDEQRRLFELHHLRHQPIQEIARTLRKSEDSVKSNLYRARKLLLAR
jgi:RNA polymerase sigma-70 factor (ECF subfamily)